MGRTARKRSEPHLPPVERIEVSSAHSGRRLTLAVLFLAVGVVAIAYGFIHLMGASSGWQQVDANSTESTSCASDFILYYDLGQGEMSASAEKRALTTLYTDAAVEAYELFNGGELFSGRNNVCYLNRHPNEVVTVEPGLYRALERVQSSGDRSLYLGPVYEIYNGIFSCADDVLTVDFDPRQNDELREYFAQCAAYARDSGAVDVELLGEGQVRLHVSEEYLAFAQEEEIERFIDFYWMRNAFIMDYLAETLVEEGFSRGVLSTYDGYVRNLSGSDEQFGFNVYDKVQDQVTQAATMAYSGGISIVYLHSYPMNVMDEIRFYQMKDGQVRSAYVDTADGLCRCALNDLVGCSWDMSCAEVLLRLIPVFVTEQFRPEALDALAAEGVYSVYCQDRTVYYNSDELTMSVLYADDEIQYSASLREPS